MLAVLSVRAAFSEQAQQLQRHFAWLTGVAHWLEPAHYLPEMPFAQTVAARLDDHLTTLLAHVQQEGDEQDQLVVTHIEQTFRHRWWGLFACYDVPGLPRTNNDLETFIRQLKTTQRRITGRKAVHDFVLRYGPYAAFLDPTESVADLLARLQQVSHDDFLRTRQALETRLRRERKRHRFRYHRQDYLADLEARWAQLIQQPAAS